MTSFVRVIRPLIDRAIEIGSKSEVEKQARRGEDDGHYQREGERQPKPDRQRLHRITLNRVKQRPYMDAG